MASHVLIVEEVEGAFEAKILSSTTFSITTPPSTDQRSLDLATSVEGPVEAWRGDW
jgi:hypothetical protein